MKKAELTFDFAKKLIHNKENGGYIVNLYSRWLDEQEYEDINEYGEAFEKNLGFAKNSLTMTKRPFGFKFNGSCCNVPGVIHICCKSKGNRVSLSANFTPKEKPKDIVTITCYGKTDKMERSKAIKFYWEAVCACEGHERDRYLAILQQLKAGYTKATDKNV
jgi:hypothetical protein